MIKFKFLTGDMNWKVYGGKFVSPKLNNGDFDYWLVLEVINMHEATGEENQPKYNVSLHAVSPDQAGQENLDKALESCGCPDVELTDLIKVETLDSYGVHAVLWHENGNNLNKLLKAAREQAQCINGLFGFYMDRPENKIGSTGWEFIKGDLNSGLARIIDSGSTEGKILAKMHGITA